MRQAFRFVLKFLIYLRFINPLQASVVWKPFSVHFSDTPAIRRNFFPKNFLFFSFLLAIDVARSGICGALHVADPPNACFPLSAVASNETNEINKFVLIIRGQCTFHCKIQNAQAAGYRAAIVYDDRDKLPKAQSFYLTYPEGINTFATFVSLEAVVYLKEHARGRAGECCIFPQSHAWVKFVRKIFLSGMAILTLIIMLFLIICKYITTGHSSRRHRQEQNQQLPRSLLCLQDYQDGETLKILPCTHGHIATYRLSCSTQ
ncbi:Receptor region transmembrane domain- and RING domain-containing protein 1 [Citrus sinensis]|nr:Receptor region transmembrane domain- and RING domain-containing protein 1 [Citrus sinensis]